MKFYKNHTQWYQTLAILDYLFKNINDLLKIDKFGILSQEIPITEGVGLPCPGPVRGRGDRIFLSRFCPAEGWGGGVSYNEPLDPTPSYSPLPSASRPFPGQCEIGGRGLYCLVMLMESCLFTLKIQKFKVCQYIRFYHWSLSYRFQQSLKHYP